MSELNKASAFGLNWCSDIALDHFNMPSEQAAVRRDDIAVRRTSVLSSRVPIRVFNRGFVCADGLRFTWNDEVTFDMFDGERIDYRTGAGWRGALPFSFYSTMAALTVAWRGALPLHASAVEIAGKAVLIFGRSGAGKSSLAAGLINLGARLVADDLTVARVDHAQGTIEISRGRSTMRQHEDMAKTIDAELRAAVPDDPRGKWLVRPRARVAVERLPLGRMLLLGAPKPIVTNLFRPRWLAALPNHGDRLRDAFAIETLAPSTIMSAVEKFDAVEQSARAREAMAMIEAS